MNEEFQPEAEFDPVASQWESRLTAMILGEASDFEIDQLMQLIESNPAVAKLYRQLLAVHQMMGEVSAGEFPYGTGAANGPETSGVSDASSAAGHGKLDQDWKLSDDRRQQLEAVLAGKTDEVVFHTISDTSSGENGIVDRIIKSEDQKLHRRRLGGLPLKIVLGGSTVAALVVVGAVLFVPSSGLLETGWVATDSAVERWEDIPVKSADSGLPRGYYAQDSILNDKSVAGSGAEDYFGAAKSEASPRGTESMLNRRELTRSSGDAGVSAKAALQSLSESMSTSDQLSSGFTPPSFTPPGLPEVPSFGQAVDASQLADRSLSTLNFPEQPDQFGLEYKSAGDAASASRGGAVAGSEVAESRSSRGRTWQYAGPAGDSSIAANQGGRLVESEERLNREVSPSADMASPDGFSNFDVAGTVGGIRVEKNGVLGTTTRGLAAGGLLPPSGPGGAGGAGGGFGGGGFGGGGGGMNGQRPGGQQTNGLQVAQQQSSGQQSLGQQRSPSVQLNAKRDQPTESPENRPGVTSNFYHLESEALVASGRPVPSSAPSKPKSSVPQSGFALGLEPAIQPPALQQEQAQLADKQQITEQQIAEQQIPGQLGDLMNRRQSSAVNKDSSLPIDRRFGRGGQTTMDDALLVQNELNRATQDLDGKQLNEALKSVEPKSWFEGDVPKTESAVASFGKQSEAEPQSHIESTFQAGAIRKQKFLDQVYELDSVEETGVPFDDRRPIAYPAESSNDAAGKKLADSTTTVDVPDGGTIVFGGVKRRSSDSFPEMADRNLVLNRSTTNPGASVSILDLKAKERLLRSAQLFGDQGTGSPRVVVRPESATEESKVKESGTDESGAKASLAEISRLNSLWGFDAAEPGESGQYYRMRGTVVEKEIDSDGDGIAESLGEAPVELSVTDSEVRFDPSSGTAVMDGRSSLERLSRKSENRLAAPAELNEESAADNAFSTFSLHVSDVSFKLANSALAQGQWPDPEKIRIEEFVNAIDYRDPLPAIEDKVACQVEQAIHPFYQQRNVLRVSMRTAATGRSSSVPLRLTLLLDNSGSMDRSDRSQTVQRAVDSLAKQLGPADQITLISFANKPRLLADQLNGVNAGQLVPMIAGLPSEGGTNFETALQLATEKAMEQHQGNAQNRIVLLTDGAVNLGDANPDRLSKLVTQMRDNRIAFDAAGISAQDLNDEVLESLTRQGDGRYYLLDSEESVEDGFAEQLAGALRPSAKNVKIQVEFNPQRVGNYKLLGFEKHRLNKEDFRNDAVDAAELSAEEAGVAVYQFEAMPEGSGDVGAVSVRFQDLNTGQMVERRWPIPYDPSAPRVEESSTSMKLATASAMLAAKLKGDALGSNVELKALGQLIADLPDAERNERRVVELNNMIQQSRQISEGR